MKISRFFALALSVIAAFVFLLPSAAYAFDLQTGVTKVSSNECPGISPVIQFEADFDLPFSEPPVVVATVQNNFSYPVDDTFAVTIKEVYTTGFWGQISRVDGSICFSQHPLVNWIAVGE